MEPVGYVLGGALLSVVTGVVGKYIGSNGKVKEDTCDERRLTCNKLVDEKLHTIDSKLDIILTALKKNNFLSM